MGSKRSYCGTPKVDIFLNTHRNRFLSHSLMGSDSQHTPQFPNNAKKISDLIGTFESYDSSTPTQNFKAFMRIRIRIDVTKSLKTGIFINRENGTIIWLPFRYERLSDFCYQCSKLGHPQSSCNTTPPPSYGVLVPRRAFGPWLRANFVVPAKEKLNKSNHHQPKDPVQNSNLNPVDDKVEAC